MKDIKDYLHLYFKEWGSITESNHEMYNGGEWALSAKILHEAMMGNLKFTPHLRPISDMTEEETSKAFSKEVIDGKFLLTTHYETVRELLKQGFDLFGLIESGLAIDKTKLKDG